MTELKRHTERNGRTVRPLRTRLTGALLAVLALTTATACGGSSAADPAKKPATTTTTANRVEPLENTPAPSLPATVLAADGKKVTVEKAGRLVPLSGSLSEIVFTLGLGDRVVARDITATFEQAEKLPVVTRGHDVSAESVLSLKPDLVLAETTTGPEEAMDQIRAAGIPVLVVAPAHGLDDVGPRIRAVADALGVPSAGKQLAERSQERIAAVRRKFPGKARSRGSPSSICAAPPPSTSSAVRTPAPAPSSRRPARSTQGRVGTGQGLHRHHQRGPYQGGAGRDSRDVQGT